MALPSRRVLYASQRRPVLAGCLSAVLELAFASATDLKTAPSPDAPRCGHHEGDRMAALTKSMAYSSKNLAAASESAKFG